jgi:hypothetical protein
MSEKKTRRVLQLARVTGDGQPVKGPMILVLRDPATNALLVDEAGTPEVFMSLRSIPEEERKAVIAEFTTLEKDPQGGKGLFELTDYKAANEELLDRAILSWEGFAGADDRPLVCTRATKLLLEANIRNEVWKKVFGAEVREVLAESFR